jgi:hypothetical protein
MAFVLASMALLFGVRVHAAAQTTAFTYQGHLLQNGAPANGAHDFVFTLWDAASGGNKIGPTISQSGYPVANGVFNIDLDFGANVFTGSQRYLEVNIDGKSLTPRQAITSSPVAVYALSAASGNIAVSGTTASQFSNDHLYAGVNLAGLGRTMVMIASPAFNPPGTSTVSGYTAAVNVHAITNQVQSNTTLGGGPGGGIIVATASLGDARMLVEIDPAYKDFASKLFVGGHYNNLQVDVLATDSAGVGYVAQSFCYGKVYVTDLQPMPQTGLFEMQIVAASTGIRIASLGPTGKVKDYVETGWDFVNNTLLSTAPCVN